MSISIFDLFKIGIGPSSSHTVGPMRAARMFVVELEAQHLLEKTQTLKADLYGSLALTGKGHGTDKAILLGLEGLEPDKINPDSIEPTLNRIRAEKTIWLYGRHSIRFTEAEHLTFYRRETLPFHSNGMRFTAFDESGAELFKKVYYSVGGGFVLSEAESANANFATSAKRLPHPFKHGRDLLEICKAHDFSISELMLKNEKVWRDERQIKTGLLRIWQVMQECVKRGCSQDGMLPGGLKVKRRASTLYHELTDRPEHALRDPLTVMDWVNLYALAVNEENAAGGRVVTAPTNGAAGIVPAVLHYYDRFCIGANEEGIIKFLLAAAAIGILYKENASISGAEVGCQGEVGVACSMAAAGLTEALGGTPEQVENAAEIAMEHNLGLTCDPVGGLVQIPCIERNAMGSIKAINASRMALRGDGTHHISLDMVIRTMRQTGADMKTKYKETSQGGLAVNIVEC
jgi:L-serine dehydratase